jgi:hypothetical protein
MTGPGLQQEEALRLLGRDPECAAIERLLEDARAGAGGALVVRGKPGMPRLRRDIVSRSRSVMAQPGI